MLWQWLLLLKACQAKDLSLQLVVRLIGLLCLCTGQLLWPGRSGRGWRPASEHIRSIGRSGVVEMVLPVPIVLIVAPVYKQNEIMKQFNNHLILTVVVFSWVSTGVLQDNLLNLSDALPESWLNITYLRNQKWMQNLSQSMFHIISPAGRQEDMNNFLIDHVALVTHRNEALPNCLGTRKLVWEMNKKKIRVPTQENQTVEYFFTELLLQLDKLGNQNRLKHHLIYIQMCLFRICMQ
jgi:hypothetical protein